ncbi:hypothetical protein ACFL0H_00625 [Thermodesulfobacteriota bacterium]
MVRNKSLKTIYLFTCLGISLFIFLNAGCQFYKRPVSHVKPFPFKTGKIVVLGFRPAMSPGAEPGVIRSPVAGTVFMSEPVPQRVAEKMTVKLFDRLQKVKGYQLIGPNQASGVFASLVASEQGMSEIDIFQRIGQALSADAVMIGYIYRWREREGKDYSVNRPASAAFDLYLISSVDKAVLWKGKFDKTQKSLSENLFDMGTFLKGRGRWMTVENLAEMGLIELLDKSLMDKEEEKETKY